MNFFLQLRLHLLVDLLCQRHGNPFYRACSNVAKYNLCKVRPEPVQPAVSLLTVSDLRGGPQEICRPLHRTTCAVQLADLCGSFAVCVSESLRVFLKTRNGEIVLRLA